MKRAISIAQEAERQKLGEKLDGEDKKGNVFNISEEVT